MPDQPDRCPMCGGAKSRRYSVCRCEACRLPRYNWPRVAELVAIRDAAVAWDRAMSRDDIDRRIVTSTRLRELARQEAENERPRQPPETPAN